MEVRKRTIGLLAVAVLVAWPALYVLFEAADRTVGLAVAIAAIAVLVGSYVSVATLVVRAAGDEQASERIRSLRFRAHIPIMLIAPMVIMAAHPWGMATVAVAAGLLALCHWFFLHAMFIVAFVLHRRRAEPHQS